MRTKTARSSRLTGAGTERPRYANEYVDDNGRHRRPANSSKKTSAVIGVEHQQLDAYGPGCEGAPPLSRRWCRVRRSRPPGVRVRLQPHCHVGERSTTCRESGPSWTNAAGATPAQPAAPMGRGAWRHDRALQIGGVKIRRVERTLQRRCPHAHTVRPGEASGAEPSINRRLTTSRTSSPRCRRLS